ncbi:pentapeptide repeat-containing protein [Ideonella sp. YS5]|uniref:pentapeptide repeat-containing protein n=1 Tax=Ideonella sp. YS5 TaxID=3453714 RepID=UPI003EEAC0CF
MLLGSELRIAVVVLVVAAMLLYAISRPCYHDNACYGGNQFLAGVLVEAHGMLLDLLVIGFVVVWLNRRAQRDHESIQFQEEIDSLRGSRSAEAGVRILYLARLLNKNRITSIFLANAHFDGLDLRGDVQPWATKRTVDLSGAYAPSASFAGSTVAGVNFREANLQQACFAGASCGRADFTGALLLGVDFRDARLQHADFTRSRHLKAQALAQAKSLRGAAMSERLKAEVLALNPGAFDDEPFESEVGNFLEMLDANEIAQQLLVAKEEHDLQTRLALTKSYGAQAFLSMLFGPLGLIYSAGWKAGLGLTVAALALCMFEPDAIPVVFLATWLLSAIAGIVAVHRHNAKIDG